jgi:hypothetical protein
MKTEKKVEQGLDWLNKQIEKDKIEIDNEKKKFIEQLLKTDKRKMFEVEEPKKMSFFEKLGKILGYGEKR